MKFTLGWLKDHLDTDATLDQIVEALNRLGLEVEAAEDRAAAFAPFLIGKVVGARQHPNADKLRLCTVDLGPDFDGGAQPEVVCGAPNAREGITICYAPVGAVIPESGAELKPAKIRGVESRGMLCSAREMGLGEDHDGIMELDPGAPIGGNFAAFMGLDDPVIEIAITPNRPDALGVRGIARDLAAEGLGPLKPDPWGAAAKGAIEEDGDGGVALRLDDTAACPMFAGRVIAGLTNGPSPAWLQQRLTAIGLRPINALVDVTNYVSYDRARPLHVYDAAKLRGTVHARLAKAGERVLALDGKTYALSGSECVIADDTGAIGLGGVMGGETTGAQPDTTEVFIESALFDPIRTAETGRAHNIQSDARYRFERGVDPETPVEGIEVATRMILALCGGTARTKVVAGAPPEWRRTYTLRKDRTATLGGLDVDPTRQQDILEALGFDVTEAGATFTVAPPSWRLDVHGEADLVEEICRVVGLDAIPAVQLPRSSEVGKPSLNPELRRVRAARRLLAGRGLVECVTYSFIHGPEAKLFGHTDERLHLLNPISADMDVMRPSILPSLIAAVRRNVHRGLGDAAVFEIGPAYVDVTTQRRVAAGVRRGATAAEHWSKAARPVDVYDAKADVLAVLAELGVPTDKLTFQPVAEHSGAPSTDHYHPGRGALVKLGPKTVLATFGELHPLVLKHMDVDGPLVGFEVFLDALPRPKAAKGGRTKPALDASDLQAVDRDFAFVVEEDVPAAEVLSAARGADKALITGADVFDVYRGKGVPEGRKSLAVRVRLTPRAATLTDAEIEAVAEKIVAKVGAATGGVLRG